MPGQRSSQNCNAGNQALGCHYLGALSSLCARCNSICFRPWRIGAARCESPGGNDECWHELLALMSIETQVCLIAPEDAGGSVPQALAAAGLPCACYPTVDDFLASCPARIGCAVCDARRIGIDVLRLAEQMDLAASDVSLILLVEPGDVALAVRAMERGALTVLAGFSAERELADAVRWGLDIAARRRARRRRWIEFDQRLNRLTRRERELLELLVAGKSNEQLARHIGVSVRTVDRRRGRLLRQLQVQSVVELAFRFACWQRGPAGGRWPRQAMRPPAREPRNGVPD